MKKDLVTDSIHEHIYWIRGCKVMLDRDLALLYGVETKALLQAVKRNKDRFPEDFMFQLNWKEASLLKLQPLEAKGVINPRSQFVTLESGHNFKYRPYVFTEQGVAMLSSALRSKRAIQVNIAIMRVFVKLRGLWDSNKELLDIVLKHDHEI